MERNGICCEAECGTCGGAGCAGRPGGSVRWCLLVVLSLALCYHATLANDAVLFVPGLKKRGKCRRDPGPIDCLAFGSETCTTQPRNVGRFDEQWYSLRLVGHYGRRTLCARRTCISLTVMFFFELGLGIHSFMSSPGFHHELVFGEIRECLNFFSVNNVSQPVYISGSSPF